MTKFLYRSIRNRLMMRLESGNKEEKSKINSKRNFNVYNAIQGREDKNYLVKKSNFKNQNDETIKVYRKRCKNL